MNISPYISISKKMGCILFKRKKKLMSIVLTINECLLFKKSKNNINMVLIKLQF